VASPSPGTAGHTEPSRGVWRTGRAVARLSHMGGHALRAARRPWLARRLCHETGGYGRRWAHCRETRADRDVGPGWEPRNRG